MARYAPILQHREAFTWKCGPRHVSPDSGLGARPKIVTDGGGQRQPR